MRSRPNLRWHKPGERDNVDRFYHTAEWERFSKTFRALNPICQLIVDGVQCRYPSKEVHHLVSPRVNFNKRVDPANAVALCPEHHPKSEGEPDIPREYVPTHWLMGATFSHPKQIVLTKPSQIELPEPGKAVDLNTDFTALLNLRK